MADQADTADWLMGGGGLVLIGGGLRWAWNALWGRADKRERALDAREQRLDEEEAKAALDLKARVGVIEGALRSVSDQLEQHRIALHILVAKVAREDPAAPELEQVANVLGNAFPLHLHVPPEMADALFRLDRGGQSA